MASIHGHGAECGIEKKNYFEEDLEEEGRDEHHMLAQLITATGRFVSEQTCAVLRGNSCPGLRPPVDTW